jgi:hypothetical protein
VAQTASRTLEQRIANLEAQLRALTTSDWTTRASAATPAGERVPLSVMATAPAAAAAAQETAVTAGNVAADAHTVAEQASNAAGDAHDAATAAQQAADEATAAAAQAVSDAAAAADRAQAAEDAAGAVTGDVAAAQDAADAAAGQAAAALTAAQNAASTGTSAQQAADTAASAAAAAQEAADAAGTAAAQADADAAAAAATAAQAVADAAAAQTAAGNAATAASGAQGTANTALTAANGRNRFWAQATAPTPAAPLIAGDVWIDTANGRRISVHTGSAWVVQQLSTAALTAITASDVLVSGSVLAAQLHADSINGKTITGATLRTAASGQRVQIDATNGFVGYNPSGTAVTRVGTDGKLTALDATIMGVIRSADTAQGRAELHQTTDPDGYPIGRLTFYNYGFEGGGVSGRVTSRGVGNNIAVNLEVGSGAAGVSVGMQDAAGGGQETTIGLSANFLEVAGQVTGMAYAVLYATTGQTPLNGWVTLNLAAEAFDTHGGHDPVSWNSRWTCPAGQAGLYAVIGQVVFTIGPANVDVNRNARIMRNGVTVPYGAGNSSGAGANLAGTSAITGVKLLWLNPGDYVEVQGYSNTTWGTATYADAATSLQLVRLR